MYWMNEHNGINSCINKKWTEMMVLCDYLCTTSDQGCPHRPVWREGFLSWLGAGMRLVTAPRKGNRTLVTVSDMQHYTTLLVSGEQPTFTTASSLEGHPCLVPDNAVRCVG